MAELSKETKGHTGGAGRQRKHTEIEQRNTQPMACGMVALHRMALTMKRQHTNGLYCTYLNHTQWWCCAARQPTFCLAHIRRAWWQRRVSCSRQVRLEDDAAVQRLATPLAQHLQPCTRVFQSCNAVLGRTRTAVSCSVAAVHVILCMHAAQKSP
jgi:hypothetical protein